MNSKASIARIASFSIFCAGTIIFGVLLLITPDKLTFLSDSSSLRIASGLFSYENKLSILS